VAVVDYFLKIDGIKGESADVKHKDEIDLEAFSWGETMTAPAPSGGGGGAGKVHLQDFHFTTKVNKASPLLFLACAMGKHIKQAIFTARKAGKSQQEFLIFKFTDLLITSYQVGGAEAGQALPIDSVSFNFAKVEYEYKAQKPDGSLDAAIKAGWDAKLNKKL
jgi:type VI secretion system secreted protein Hcp